MHYRDVLDWIKENYISRSEVEGIIEEKVKRKNEKVVSMLQNLYHFTTLTAFDEQNLAYMLYLIREISKIILPTKLLNKKDE